jgi:putative two-component system response regulator
MDAETRTAVSPLRAIRIRTGTSATILVVDDNPENLSQMGELLAPEFRVLAANSGRRALEIAAGETPPDLILLDVMMPVVDGYFVLEQLRSRPELRGIPVIFVTAMDGTDDEERGLELGAVDYITKPLRPAIVLARVRMQLELKDARDRLQGQNVFLESEIARRMSENQLIQDITIHALARLAETRDPETGNHLRRTQEYVRLLATRLKDHPRFAPDLDATTISLLAKSAPLHDIGKVGIPDHILLKRGPLTPAEWKVMETHTRMGAEAIEQAERDSDREIEFLALGKQIARHHHEWWNGNGYPDGLAGDAIPMAARLMALADVFDALISRRVYKDSMSFEEARRIIVGQRGLQFDPDITDAFVASFDEFCAIAMRYADAEAAVNAKIASMRGAA